jgi:hypothetical protein
LYAVPHHLAASRIVVSIIWLQAALFNKVVPNFNSQETAQEAAHLPSLRHSEHQSNLLEGEDAHMKIFTKRPLVTFCTVYLTNWSNKNPLSATAGSCAAWNGVVTVPECQPLEPAKFLVM